MIDWLMDTLLATSALMLIVLLVREPVRTRFGARVAYGLWLIPAARLFMPTLTHTVERRIPAPLPPFADPLHESALAMANLTVPEPSAFDRIGGWSAVALLLWLAVAAYLFLSRLIAFHRDRRAILATSAPFGDLGSVRIIRSPEVASPIALGIVDRLIAVPHDFEIRYGPRERRLVLDHELAHHKSGDLVANLFAFVLLCLQWFNPLAWAAHTAFRFDQEAACDARVLDKVSAGDRAAYGRAIAKAASGRALLFASALDRPNTLKRRLKSMLTSPKPRHRTAGTIVIFAGIAVALPLTASRAVEYLDIPAAPAAAVHASPSVAPAVAEAAVVQAAPVARPVRAAIAAPRKSDSSDMRFDDDLSINGDFITIDGQRKRWEELTPAEKTRVRAAVAKARTELANVHIDRDRIMRSVASVPDKVQIEKIRSDVARARASVAESMRNLQLQRDQLRRTGVDPAVLQAELDRAMQSVQSVDMDEIERSVAAVDPAKIAQEIDGAERSVQAARADLDRMQARMDADPRH